MIDGMERERAFKQVGAIDLNRSEPDGRFGGGSVNAAGGSRATWTGKPERVSEREASESTAYHLFCVVGFDAVGFQVSAKLGEMLVVPRFNRAEHIDG